ncbi:hypothetical protein CCR75_003169 [Bremia lactucae]|uniref:Uncharacterized protein n=1 Tax=Bremia lactucae TaxID=4779 RepID=A0A976NXY9_BRELC|nr:hypothetical protein CCR75_003169 [Bremia lactucae]
MSTDFVTENQRYAKPSRFQVERAPFHTNGNALFLLVKHIPKQSSCKFMSGFRMSPQSVDYLPSTSPSNAVWTAQELQTLQAGLTQFPADQFDNVTRYIKIAAMLPRKCVRDVTYKVKALRSSPGEQALTKRMKIEPYKDLNQPLPATAELEEARFAALLQDNALVINTMRTNLLNGRADENRSQMRKFQANCDTVLAALGEICTSIPPLPLQLDTSLIEEDQCDRSTSSANTSLQNE